MSPTTRVLVLGARGLLGSSLVPHLRECGYDVVEHTRDGSADVAGDLTDPDVADGVITSSRPDVVVNLAALTDVDRCEREPKLAFLQNVQLVENIAVVIKGKRRSAHLVQVSTDQVYDGVGPHDEAHVMPSNLYAFSKYAGELAARMIPSTIVRTNFFGPSHAAGRVTLSDWILRALREQRRITVFSDIQFSPLTIASLVRTLERVVSLRVPGVFNAGSKGGMSKADFAFALAASSGLDAQCLIRGTSKDVPMVAYRPSDMRMDSTRFERAFAVQLPRLTDEIRSLPTATSSYQP